MTEPFAEYIEYLTSANIYKNWQKIQNTNLHWAKELFEQRTPYISWTGAARYFVLADSQSKSFYCLFLQFEIRYEKHSQLLHHCSY